MKKREYIILSALLLLFTTMPATAQDIEIKGFEHNITSLIGSTRPEIDNTGEYCAIIRFAVRDTTFVIESNVGIMKRETTPTADEIIVWVPTAAKRLTIRHEGLFPLRDYAIPVKLEPKKTYDAVLQARPTSAPSLKGREEPTTTQKKKETTATQKKKEPTSAPTTPNPTLRKEGTQRETQKTDTLKLTLKPEGTKDRPSRSVRTTFATIGIGYQPMTISGPTLSLGIETNHHLVELSGTYGLGKSDELYFYDGNYYFIGARQYTPVRMQLRYGYELKVSKAFGIAPMIGGAMNIFSSKSGDEVNASYKDYYLKASSFVVTPSVRLAVLLGQRVKLHVTPEYSLGLSKSNNCKTISDNDSKFKSWTDGFQVSMGINILL